MPSASNVKADKQQVSSAENGLPESSAGQSAHRQTVVFLEHKIRNLEKRKSKLESYRDLQSAGKELNADQKTAVAKYTEVICQLETARDVFKTFLSFTASAEKEAKKQAKRETAVRAHAETARIREILLLQDTLLQMGRDEVRQDFLQGTNGAAKVTEEELKLLDDLYPMVTPRHDDGNPTCFTTEIQQASEHIYSILEGKQKEFLGSTYAQVKEVVGRIVESGYFDQSQAVETGEEVEQMEDIAVANDVVMDPEAVVVAQVEQQAQLPPNIEALTIDSIPPPQQQQQQMMQQPQQQPPTMDQVAPPQIEQQIKPEQMYYQQQPPQQPPQPPRPITEIVGNGKFFFLQESELDAPEPIPSQTFTNQAFVPNQQPIPIPTLFPNIPTNLPPQPVVVPPQTTGNNGIDDVVVVPPQHRQQSDEIVHKNPSAGGNRHPRSNNNHNSSNNSSATTNNHSYYQNNNNGYTNRPRGQQQQRSSNGPRPGGNRQ